MVDVCRKVVPHANITGYCVLYLCSLCLYCTSYLQRYGDVLVADHLQGRNSLTCTHSAESAAPPICVPSCGALSPLSQSHETRGLVSVGSGAVKHAANTRTRTKRVLRTPCEQNAAVCLGSVGITSDV